MHPEALFPSRRLSVWKIIGKGSSAALSGSGVVPGHPIALPAAGNSADSSKLPQTQPAAPCIRSGRRRCSSPTSLFCRSYPPLRYGLLSSIASTRRCPLCRRPIVFQPVTADMPPPRSTSPISALPSVTAAAVTLGFTSNATTPIPVMTSGTAAAANSTPAASRFVAAPVVLSGCCSLRLLDFAPCSLLILRASSVRYRLLSSIPPSRCRASAPFSLRLLFLHIVAASATISERAVGQHHLLVAALAGALQYL